MRNMQMRHAVSTRRDICGSSEDSSGVGTYDCEADEHGRRHVI